jgi:hypothetical protein
MLGHHVCMHRWPYWDMHRRVHTWDMHRRVHTWDMHRRVHTKDSGRMSYSKHAWLLTRVRVLVNLLDQSLHRHSCRAEAFLGLFSSCTCMYVYLCVCMLHICLYSRHKATHTHTHTHIYVLSVISKYVLSLHCMHGSRWDQITVACTSLVWPSMYLYVCIHVCAYILHCALFGKGFVCIVYVGLYVSYTCICLAA